MNNEHLNEKDMAVTTIVSSETVALIDHYADARDLYRSNWLRQAISEKLSREIEAETGIKMPQRETA